MKGFAIMTFFLTLLIAVMGGLTGVKLKIPAGAIVGSMTAVMIYSITTGNAWMPSYTSVISQIGTGAFIGSKIGRSDLSKIKRLSKPIGLMMVTLFTCAIITGFFMSKAADLDVVTAMFSCAPGGILDMSLICDELGGNSSITAMFQTMRVAVVIATFPGMINLIIKRTKTTRFEQSVALASLPQADGKVMKRTNSNNILNVVYTMLIALILGILGRLLRVPAGAMVFSMIAVATFNICTSYCSMPVALRKAIQFLGGATIGAKITWLGVMTLVSSWELLLTLIGGLVVMNLLTAFLLHKVCKWDITTALFASAPGGVADMSIIASEMGADTAVVAFMQLLRLTAIIAFYPWIIISLL